MLHLGRFLDTLDTLNQNMLGDRAVPAKKKLKNRENIFSGLDEVLSVSKKVRKLLVRPEI